MRLPISAVLRRVTAVIVAAALPLLTVAQVPAASAATVPATPAFGPAIDGYSSYVAETTCSPTEKPGVAKFRDLLLRTYGSTRWTNILRSCSSSSSGHEEGRSLDITFRSDNATDHAKATDLLTWLLATDSHGNKHANARRLGIMYVQYHDKMWRAYDAGRGWAVDGSCSSSSFSTACHDDHIHFSFGWDGANAKTTWFTGGSSTRTCTDMSVAGDVDGDGRSDLVVGMPGWSRSVGAVDLRVSSAASSVLTRPAAGLGTGVAGDRFGAAVVLADLDLDGCDELVVGSPGAGGEGRVFVVPGTATGFARTGTRILTGVSTGDGFGTAVAIARNRAGTGFDLWVGAPTDDVGTAADAGSVSHFSVTTGGGTFAMALVETITQDTAGVPGAAEPGDRFGAVLSASRYGAFVGQPSEDIGSAVDAGSVTLLATTDTDAPFDDATGWAQGSGGVAGAPEANDRFGGAVSAMEQYAIAGAAGEDLGASADAGSVQVFRALSLTEMGPGVAYTQNSPGLPGGAEAGDRFGAAVLLFQDRCFDESVDAAVGAPGEDITVSGSSQADAGTVATFTVSDSPSCAPGSVNQDTVLSGVPESGDRLGSALAVGRHREPSNGDINDRFYIGAPGENIGTTTDAGLVQATSMGTPTNPTEFLVAGTWRSSAGYTGGTTANLAYGAVLAAPAG